ncbi:MAG TPA: cyclic pyranopterin monophosphate synthase MoaC [Polyangia bacterium]|nr:cyclic pyranopterin monophosphate synthase MoaC [Polyangia bacterium]
MGKLTHFDDAGAAHMVEVGHKAESDREAVAAGVVEMEAATLAAIRAGAVEKGDVLGVARLAAIQGCKRTAELIPLCHPLRVTGVEVALEPRDDGGRPRVEIRATVRAHDRTGVEMEALTAVAVCGLTIYDMCKSADRSMRLTDVRLLEKHGGKSGHWTRGT